MNHSVTTHTPTATELKLAGMLVENTGTSILDSGSAYGRHWQKNQGKTVQDFIDAPVQLVDRDFSYVVLDVFHYLNERLEYAPELDAEFRNFDKTSGIDGTWSDVITAWLESLGIDTSDDDFYGEHCSFNTYNFDGESLSQTIAGNLFSYGDQSYVLLQIHGGCDVRGGYTDPVVFSVSGEMFPFDCTDAVVSCESADCRFSVAQYGSDFQSDFELPEHWEYANGCPVCGSGLV